MMRNIIKILILVAAMAAATSLSLPAEAPSQHYYRHGYGHGYGYRHGYGHGYGYGRGYGYSGYSRYDYGPNQYSNDGAVRIEVDPKESREEIQVYVDEGHAGVVDDFDGAFQRLYLPPGKHEIEMRLDGYKTVQVAIFVSPGKTHHIRGRMEPLT